MDINWIISKSSLSSSFDAECIKHKYEKKKEITKSIVTANNQNKITTEKGPVMLLYELFTDITFNCTQTVGPQHAKFKTIVTVNGCQQFEGTGEKFY